MVYVLRYAAISNVPTRWIIQNQPAALPSLYPRQAGASSYISADYSGKLFFIMPFTKRPSTSATSRYVIKGTSSTSINLICLVHKGHVSKPASPRQKSWPQQPPLSPPTSASIPNNTLSPCTLGAACMAVPLDNVHHRRYWCGNGLPCATPS